MVELRWSKLALKDMEDIISYIAKNFEENAKAFVAKIIDSIETMSTFPYAGRIVPELKNEIYSEITELYIVLMIT